MPTWDLERAALAEGYALVCGCDEAGAGPLAGPVYAGAVILPLELELPGLNDSKKLTGRQRERLFEEITASAAAWSVAWATAEEIDRLDILNARLLAMERAMAGLSPQADFALIDGNRDHGSIQTIALPHRLVVKGDGLSVSIAAASILAKVSRDRYMAEQAALYPGYGFEVHKGYGTKAHYAALDKLGPCPIHRESFWRKWRAKGRDGT